MLWIYILIATLAGATIHSVRASRRGDANRAVEPFLVYLLVGYYGLAMILSGLVHLLNPGPLAALNSSCRIVGHARGFDTRGQLILVSRPSALPTQ